MSTLMVFALDESSGERIQEALLKALGGLENVVWVDGFQQCLTEISQAPPDLLVMCVDQPTAEEREFLIAFHIAAPDLPIVLVHADHDEGRVGQLLEDGAQDCVTLADAEEGQLAEILIKALSRQSGRTRETTRHRLAHHHSQEFLNAVLESSIDGMVVVDQRGIVMYANRAAANLIGDIQPLRIGDSYELDYARESTGKIKLKGEPKGEGLLDIGERIIESRATKSAWQDRPATLIMLRDVTLTYTRQTELTLLKQAIEASQEGLLISDASGKRALFWNDAFARLCAMDEDEESNPLLTKGFLDETSRSLMFDACESGTEWAGEARVQSPRVEDAPHWLRIALSPIAFGDEAPKHLLFQAQNVSRRRKIEEQLRQAQKMEALGTLAGGIAHDFNNLLSPILGYSDIIIRNGALDDKHHKWMKTIFRAAERSRKLVSQILHFSRPHEEDRGLVDVLETVKEAVDVVSATTTGDLGFSIPDEGSYVVLATPTSVMQIFLNILTNAAQAIGKKSGSIEIRFDHRQVGRPATSDLSNPVSPGRYLEITVVDSGPGISGEIISKIFDPFFTTKAVGKGTGMGLAEVLGLVRNMGGAISVQSEEGAGATFVVLLPAAPQHRSEIEASDPILEVSNVQGYRGLVIEADDDVRESLTSMLEEMGLTVQSVEKGQEGIDLILTPNEYFDICICDHVLADMTSHNIIEAISTSRPNLPIVVATGRADATLVSELMDAGAVAVLPKPLQLSEMSEVIKDVLDVLET